MSLKASLNQLKTHTQSPRPTPLVTHTIHEHPELDKLTHEQRNAVLSSDPIISVKAAAGSGKTTLLKTLAKLNTQSGLYLAYNESIVRNAKQIFPPSVECRTAHSLALSEIGLSVNLKHIRLRIGTLLPEHLIHSFQNISTDILNQAILNFHSFCISSFLDLSLFFDKHQTPLIHQEIVRFILQESLNPLGTIPIDHDTYLKIWCLYPPRKLPFNYIMIDECQDSNPPFLDAILKQSARLIFVGDPFQSIYSFRGAINAFSYLPFDATSFHLTRSHRIGPNVACLATHIVQSIDPTVPVITGGKPTDTLQSAPPLAQPYLFLARTNAGLVDKIFHIISQKKQFHCIGGLDFLHPIFSLYLNQQSGAISHLNTTYKSAEELSKALNNQAFLSDPEQDLLFACQMVSKYEKQIPLIFKHLNDFHISEINTECIVLSTLHKAKGLEFEWVELADDFPYPSNTIDLRTIEGQEEAHIFYVAITRTMKGLVLSSGRYQQWAKRILPLLFFSS